MRIQRARPLPCPTGWTTPRGGGRPASAGGPFLRTVGSDGPVLAAETSAEGRLLGALLHLVITGGLCAVVWFWTSSAIALSVDVVGVPWAVAVLVGFPPLAGAQRVELSRTHLTWTVAGRVVRLAWDDVTAVRPHERRALDRDAEPVRTVRVVVRDSSCVVDGRWWRNLVEPPEPDPAGVPVSLPPDALGLRPELLFWACVAFADPARRAAVLDGAEITARPT